MINTNLKFKIQNSKIRSGYTLIELLITVSILGILAATVAPSLNKIDESQNVQETAFAIKEKLIEAQGLAFAPPNDNNKATYYGVKLVDNDEADAVPLSAEIVRLKSDGTVDSDYRSETSYKNIKYKGGITEGKINTIWFGIGSKVFTKVSNKGTETVLENPSSKITLSIDNRTDSDERQIILDYQTGTIDIEEP